MSASQTVFCDRALLADGWATDVGIDISDGHIVTIRPGAVAESAAEKLGTVIPPMANTHCHAFQRAMAGLSEFKSSASDSFWTWRDIMYRHAASISPDDLQSIAAQLYVEMLKAGYSGVGEFHYVHHQAGGEPYAERAMMSRAVLSAADMAGIGITLLPVLYASSGFDGAPLGSAQARFGNRLDGYAEIVQSLIVDCRDAQTQRLGIALHSLRAVPTEMITEALTLTESIDALAPIHIHIAEQQLEVEQCLANRGARPIAWLADTIGLDQRWCLVHATHVDDSELQSISESHASISLCPTTEANLGDGIFPLHKWLALNGHFSIGSDSNTSVSPVEELRWLEYGQRLTRHQRNIATSETQPSTGLNLYQRALSGGERALRQGIGGLRKGARADLLVLDDDHPLLAETPSSGVMDTYIFNGNRNLVQHLMVAGRWQIRDGQHKREGIIARDFRKVMKRLRS